MKPQEIFTNKATIYDIYRPRYSTKCLSYLINNNICTSDSIIADIGCGTGIASELLLPHCSKIYGIEPNENMLSIAANKFSNQLNFIPIISSAENIALESDSVDLIVVGQAFHWFDMEKFKKEAERISKEQCKIILMWNKKDACAMESERKKIVGKYRTVYDSFHCSWEERESAIDQFFASYQRLSFPNPLINNREMFINRTLSASHAVESNSKYIESYLDDWNKYFDKYAVSGKIVIPNSTVMYIGQI